MNDVTFKYTMADGRVLTAAGKRSAPGSTHRRVLGKSVQDAVDSGELVKFESFFPSGVLRPFAEGDIVRFCMDGPLPVMRRTPRGWATVEARVTYVDPYRLEYEVTAVTSRSPDGLNPSVEPGHVGGFALDVAVCLLTVARRGC